MFQGYGLGVAGEALTLRLRELSFTAMMQQVRGYGVVKGCGVVSGTMW